MNKIKYFFILLIAASALVSCNKNDDDDVKVVPPRDYQEQYNTEKVTIESYLNAHYIEITESPGNVEDMDVVIKPIASTTTQISIMSYKDNVGTSTFPQLRSKNVNLHGITYKLYYLVLREGTGESPMNTDGVFTSYHLSYLKDVPATDKVPAYISSTFVQEVKYPQNIWDLSGLGATGTTPVGVEGWGEVFPELKVGISVGNIDGTISYKDFGAAVMFLPSGLAYYAGGGGSIPAYSPLVYNVKLYQITRLDHDNDGILDYNEDLNGDRYVRDYRNTALYPDSPENPDDTDKDGIPDFKDIDDDGDGYATFLEITKPTGKVGEVMENGEKVNYGPSKYFPFEWFNVQDDPVTPNTNEALNSEKRGIPRKPTGELTNDKLPESWSNPRKFIEDDYTTSGRLRIHLDNSYPYKKN